MKQTYNNIKTGLFFILLTMGFLSCEDFLNRPDPSAYTLSDFYRTDEQLLQSVNILYSSPWHDFSRGWIGVGDVQAGNHYQGGGSVYWLLNHASAAAEESLKDMSASLWSVNARANTILENFNMYAGPGTTLAGLNTAKGEVLVWKALAYFFMVRIYGAVPIIHDNTELMNSGEYNNLYRAKIDNVYDYIIMTLEQAIEWLPTQNKSGRIDKYSAYGLLAKVHLTKAGYGRSGDRNQADLDKAKEYAGKVINESGRELEPEYANIFRGSYNETPESLIAFRWIAISTHWTCANMQQSDLAIVGFDEYNCWGGWNGPSLDLQAAFGEDALRLNTRNNSDKRRKATMMMYGDVYPNFWRDHPEKDKAGTDGAEKVNFPNGFDFTLYFRDVLAGFQSNTGVNAVKHLVGNNADHIAEMGMPLGGQMCTSLATHILRLSDVYLIYAEAILGNAASTSDSEALRTYNAVRRRAGVTERSSITFDDIFKERRLELAYEGDNWYDFVRLSYYRPEDALARLNTQNRYNYLGITSYQMDGVDGRITVGSDGRESPRINTEEPTGQPFPSTVFTLPFPDTDLQMNQNLMKEPVDYDISGYGY